MYRSHCNRINERSMVKMCVVGRKRERKVSWDLVFLLLLLFETLRYKHRQHIQNLSSNSDLQRVIFLAILFLSFLFTFILYSQLDPYDIDFIHRSSYLYLYGIWLVVGWLVLSLCFASPSYNRTCHHDFERIHGSNNFLVARIIGVQIMKYFDCILFYVHVQLLKFDFVMLLLTFL